MKALAIGLGVVFSLATSAVRGADSVHFLGFAGVTPPPAITPAIFGNRTQVMDIEVDGAAGAVSSVSADLFQVAGQLALPLAKGMVLQKGVTLGEGTRLRVSLRFPEVQRRTEILARFTLEPRNGQAVHALGDLRFEVFPQSTTKDLVGILQTKDEVARVEVFGPGHKLRQFFTSLHVPFEDGGEGVPDNFEPNRLYIGEFTQATPFQEIQDRAPNARILVFAADESLPSGVYFERSGASVMGHVTAPLLDNIAGDPRAQLALTKMLTLLSTSSPNPSSL